MSAPEAVVDGAFMRLNISDYSRRSTIFRPLGLYWGYQHTLTRRVRGPAGSNKLSGPAGRTLVTSGKLRGLSCYRTLKLCCG
jgi:hypothetical protein